LVMGALMYGAIKPLADQAFAATPCSLTLAPSGEAVPGSVLGKLTCGGQGLGSTTIHLTLHGITTGSLNKVDVLTKSSGDFSRTVRLVPGHSYTVTATFDGDSNNQPASATISIYLSGPTGSGQNTSNAGNGQQNNSTQASFTVPCSLTVGPTPNENPISSIEGKLTCGGVGESGAIIQISGLPGGSDSITTANGGSYELGIFSPFIPGPSYTVTAKYDGNSDQHLQPASATTIINIPGSTGSTPLNNNAGNGQNTSNAGNGQNTSNAGNGQNTSNAGNGQQNNSTQASAATPCVLTVGTPSGEAVPTKVIGKLTCGGKAVPNASIDIDGIPYGTEKPQTITVITDDNGNYVQGVVDFFPSTSSGQSYTVTAKYDGNSDQHLQPASATTIINIPGSTGSTPQDTSNSGNTQDNTNAGNTQDNTNAGNTQDNTNAGNTQDNSTQPRVSVRNISFF